MVKEILKMLHSKTMNSSPHLQHFVELLDANVHCEALKILQFPTLISYEAIYFFPPLSIS